MMIFILDTKGDNQMSDRNDVTLLHVQREIKPKVESVLPFYLDGEMLKLALDFVAYLRAEKMNPGWAGVHNAWRATSKGKPICYIRLGKEWIRDTEKKWVINTKNLKWLVIPYLDHMNDYADKINEDWKKIIWDDLRNCVNCAYGCSSRAAKTVTVLGKDFSGLCPGFINKVSFVNPDEAAIKIIKRLLELEREERKG